MYFTSDWHIGHQNVLEFDKRPFKDLDHMHTELVRRYNELVKSSDTCFFLGDMGLGKKELLPPIVKSLNGKKILILGNHDKGKNAMLDVGFDLVLNSASFTIGKSIITMSHCPLRGIKREDASSMKGFRPFESWHGESRLDQYSLPDFGQFHLHGHTHKGPEERTLDRQWDVGVRANNYKPVSIAQIESWIAKSSQKL